MESTIVRDGGLHRYAEDSYYGGGAWVLLTAWLGWYYIELANQRPDLLASLEPKIQTCQHWIEKHVTSNDWLPEQVAQKLNMPSYYPQWVERWGEIASPLLWSHAKYIIFSSKSQRR